MKGRLPPTASVADAVGGAKLHAPAAARNAQSIAALITEIAPDKGHALEIASGTGQHILHFATTFPGLQWHPTDVDQTRIASIDAYAAEAGLKNIAPAAYLDATKPGWGKKERYELIIVINLLHLIPTADAAVVLQEAARALQPGGHLVLYGPFKRSGRLTSEGDAIFDAELRAADAAIGYKDDDWIMAELRTAGLHVDQREMTANNLAFVGCHD